VVHGSGVWLDAKGELGSRNFLTRSLSRRRNDDDDDVERREREVVLINSFIFL